MESLKVQGRYLCTESGEPFFYLADTAWEMLHRMSKEEILRFLDVRASQGFTCIQTVLLAEFDGLKTPNYYGKRPLLQTDGAFDPCRPDLVDEDSYWSLADFALDAAEERGLYLVLLPTWGDKFNLLWGKGPVIFNPENARAYGRFLGERYKDRDNIIWMLGGDRPLEPEHRAIVDAMAQGIKETGDTHLMTFHPVGCHNSTQFVGDAPYIDFHTAQTGHGVEHCYISDKIMLKMRRETE